MSDVQLQLAADLLGPLVEEVVFLGGATIHLWLNEAAAPPARATDDVDVLCDVHTTVEYYVFSDRLRERGLVERLNEDIVGRWRDPVSNLAIDIIPPDERVLGFTNRWYTQAVDRAVNRTLNSGSVIRAVPPPILTATKLEAWRGRGADDVLRSLDVHDVVVLANGREELLDELQAEEPDVRTFVGRELRRLLANDYFEYVIQDAVAPYGDAALARADIVRDRLTQLAEQSP